jgi:MOSC domain-containing protein YiiM
MAITAGQLLSVNVGRPREFGYNGRPAESAIWKLPITGRVQARRVNLEGDEQADHKAHGGPDKVIYAYAIEDASGGKRSFAYRTNTASLART